MSDPTGPPAPDPRRLDRAPGERYRGVRPPAAPPEAPEGSAGSTRRAILAGAVTATAGAVLYALLGQVNLDPGLVIVAGFIGWATAIAVVWGAGAAAPIPRQPVVAAVLGGASIGSGLLIAWAISRVEGGVLDPLGYTNARYGPLAYLAIGVAAGLAWLRAR